MKNKSNNLEFLSRCSFCDGEFGSDAVSVLEESHLRTILHATCPKCHTSAIFLMSANQTTGIVTLGMMTDLDRQEAANKFAKKPVSIDEVIDAHRFISAYHGNFLEFIKRNN